MYDPPEGPTEREQEDILLETLPPAYKAIRQAHLERGDFGLADIRRMMAAIYADNLARSLVHPGVLQDVVPPCRQRPAIAMAPSALKRCLRSGA